MNVITYDVYKNTVKKHDGFNPVTSEKNYSKLQFRFQAGDDWEKCTLVTASFWLSNDNIVKSDVELLSDNLTATFDIPPEFSGVKGALKVGLQGKCGEDVVIATNIITLNRNNGVIVTEGANAELYEKIISLVEEYFAEDKKQIENILADRVSTIDFQDLSDSKFPNIKALYDYHTNYVEPCYDDIDNLEENKSDKSTTYTKTEVDEAISKYDYVSESVELVDGYYCNQSGQILAHSSFNYAVLTVAVAEKYKISGRSAGNSALVVFFDKSDNMISAAGYDESGTTTTYTDFEVTVPNNVVKMILSTSKAVELTVKKYSIVSTVKDDIKSLQINKADKAETFYYDYQNITSALTKEIAYYKYTDGTKVPDTNSQSVFISTQSGERFKVSGKTAGNLALAVFFDCDKNYLSAVCYGSVTDYVDEIITVPPECCFVAFASYKTDLIVKKYQPTTNKLNEIVYEIGGNIDYLNSNLADLKDKSLYVDGDSIMYGYGSDGYSVGEFLRDKYGMTLTKGAVSGATLAVKADSDNSICTRLTALSDIYDYIIFDGGVNDVSQDITLGEITNHYKGGYDTTTTIGALEQICYTLVTNFLTVKKLFVFTHKIVNVSNPVMSDKMITCNNAIKSTLNKWGIPYVDLYNECNLCAINETINNTYFKLNSDGIGDRVHPTKYAYAKFYMPLIEAKIKNI